MVIIQIAVISLQVKFLEAHKTNTIPYCRCKRKNCSSGVKSTLVISFMWSCTVLAIFTSLITKLVHRRGRWILSIMRTSRLSS